MKLSLVVPLIVAACLAAYAQQPMPRMITVEPANGKIGDIITVGGEHLEKTQVAKVYLTDGQADVQVEVTDQAAAALKFKIPAKTKSGRFALMLLTTGKDPKLIEQPVKVTIDE
ncbi:MAG TPA: IPT/TIG domain-containing protein [Bryobacteraceae bacterium]|nr:IPT/TIG domain-containing protein [Bryobacteraceae bacterium]